MRRLAYALAVLMMGVTGFASVAPASSTPTAAPTVASPTTDKVAILVIENRSIAQIQAGAPKIWALGQQYAYATNFKAITHPSLPNYIAMGAGDTLGVKDDKNPSSHKLTATNVLGATIRAGRSAKVVADGMLTDRCRQSNYGKFAVRHTIWPYFPADRALCEKYMFDLKYLAGDVAAAKLANVEYIIPHNGNNAHDGSLKTADNWIASKVALLQSGPDWAQGRLTIVITADEDDKKSGNVIYTAVLHPSLSHKVVTTPLSLYSLSGFTSQFGHVAPLRNAATAPNMAAAFGLVVQ